MLSTNRQWLQVMKKIMDVVVPLTKDHRKCICSHCQEEHPAKLMIKKHFGDYFTPL